MTALLDDPRLAGNGRLTRHPFHELVYVIRGHYRAETLGVTWQGRPGWLYYYAPGQPHRTGFTSAKPEGILVQWHAPTGTAYPTAYYDASRRWRYLLTWLLDLYTSDERAAAEQLLPVLLRELERVAGHSQSLLPAVDVYLGDHLAEPIRIARLAAALGLSRSHFSRNFRRLTGQSPRQYTIRYRLEQARRLLTDRSVRVAEVARRCGFSSTAHLSRLFRARYWMTPRQCRQGVRPPSVCL